MNKYDKIVLGDCGCIDGAKNLLHITMNLPQVTAYNYEFITSNTVKTDNLYCYLHTCSSKCTRCICIQLYLLSSFSVLDYRYCDFEYNEIHHRIFIKKESVFSPDSETFNSTDTELYCTTLLPPPVVCTRGDGIKKI